MSQLDSLLNEADGRVRKNKTRRSVKEIADSSFVVRSKRSKEYDSDEDSIQEIEWEEYDRIYDNHIEERSSRKAKSKPSFRDLNPLGFKRDTRRVGFVQKRVKSSYNK